LDPTPENVVSPTPRAIERSYSALTDLAMGNTKNLSPLGLLSLATTGAALVSTKGSAGRLPALGWSSWNEYGCDINETVFLDTAHLLIDLGLKDLGYEYINIDDWWSDKEKRRDPVTNEIVVDAEKFPNGIDTLADRLHNLGLKIGIYSNAGK